MITTSPRSFSIDFNLCAKLQGNIIIFKLFCFISNAQFQSSISQKVYCQMSINEKTLKIQIMYWPQLCLQLFLWKAKGKSCLGDKTATISLEPFDLLAKIDMEPPLKVGALTTHSKVSETWPK